MCHPRQPAPSLLRRLRRSLSLLCLLCLPAAPAPAGPEGGRLDMTAAVALAVRDNPALKAARHELAAALARAGRDRPGFRPEVVVEGSQFVRTPRVDLPGRRDEVVLPNALSKVELLLRQPLFQFGAGGAPGARAAAMEAAARAEYQRAELDLALEAREAFLRVHWAVSQEAVAEEGLALARTQVALTRTLIAGGLQADVDLLDAQRSEAEAEAAAVLARNGTHLARADFNRVLGRPLETPVELEPAAAPPPAPEPLADLTPGALERRPETAALRHQIRAGEAGIRLAKAARLPRVDLEAAYALQTETALVPRSGVAAGVTVRVPVFNGAVDRHTVREAEERVAQLRAALAAREQAVALEIEQQRLAWTAASARLEAARRAVGFAAKAHEISLLRLERGRATQIEAAGARLALVRARAEAATAEHELRLAGVRLQRALGRP